jgi:hypothetical protein
LNFTEWYQPPNMDRRIICWFESHLRAI